MVSWHLSRRSFFNHADKCCYVRFGTAQSQPQSRPGATNSQRVVMKDVSEEPREDSMKTISLSNNLLRCSRINVAQSNVEVGSRFQTHDCRHASTVFSHRGFLFGSLGLRVIQLFLELYVAPVLGAHFNIRGVSDQLLVSRCPLLYKRSSNDIRAYSSYFRQRKTRTHPKMNFMNRWMLLVRAY